MSLQGKVSLQEISPLVGLIGFWAALTAARGASGADAVSKSVWDRIWVRIMLAVCAEMKVRPSQAADSPMSRGHSLGVLPVDLWDLDPLSENYMGWFGARFAPYWLSISDREIDFRLLLIMCFVSDILSYRKGLLGRETT